MANRLPRTSPRRHPRPERRRVTRPALVAAWLVPAVLAASSASALDRVLVFSRTVGFRHGSISNGIALVQALGAANGFSVDTTEDASDFNATVLAQYDVVVWLSTTGDVLDDAQQAAFEAYIQAGGGYVGVHAASDCEYGWPWYGGLIGGDAWFANHPAIQDATLEVADATHVSTAHLPSAYTFRDEWYNFQNDPTPSVNVLVTIDETTYSGGTMGPGHPISWNHEYDGGRAWYTAMGHRSQTFDDADFQAHLLGGIQWAAGGAVSAPALPWAAHLAAALLLVVAAAGRMRSAALRLRFRARRRPR